MVAIGDDYALPRSTARLRDGLQALLAHPRRSRNSVFNVEQNDSDLNSVMSVSQSWFTGVAGELAPGPPILIGDHAELVMDWRPQAFPLVAWPLPKTENQTVAEHSRHAVRTMSCPLATASSQVAADSSVASPDLLLASTSTWRSHLLTVA